MARIPEITVKLDEKQMEELKALYSEKINRLRKVLEMSLYVMEKGIEVRMHDHWPALQAILPDAIKRAKETLEETAQ